MTHPSPKRILVVEDDTAIREGIVEALQSDGLEAIPVESGTEAVEQFPLETVDLVLLDIMLPGVNGYDVCRRIRETDKRIPILLLSAKSEEIDQVLGLELGADDYITKPFRVRELLARIHSALRRAEFMVPDTNNVSTADTFLFGDVEIDRKRFIVIQEDEEVELTQRELTLIELFSAHPNEALSRDFLLNEAWSIDYSGTTRTLDQHIAKLRAKVNTSPGQGCIKTVHGVGYKFVD